VGHATLVEHDINLVLGAVGIVVDGVPPLLSVEKRTLEAGGFFFGEVLRSMRSFAFFVVVPFFFFTSPAAFAAAAFGMILLPRPPTAAFLSSSSSSTALLSSRSLVASSSSFATN
jgi:hypothetical protein